MQTVRTAQRVVKAPAQEIFELLATPERHSEFDGSGSVQGTASGPQRLGLGDEFGMRMRKGAPYTTRNTVVEFEEGRRIAWRTATKVGDRLLFGGQVWRYELTDRGDGTTLVKESFDLSNARPAAALDALSGGSAQKGMISTLENLARHFG